MAIRYISFKKFKSMVIHGNVLKIRYDKHVYNIGCRLTFITYFIFDCETCCLKMYKGWKQFMQNCKINGKTICEIWDEVEVIKIYTYLNVEDEANCINKRLQENIYGLSKNT